MDRLILRVKLHRLQLPVVHACALLHSHLKKQGVESTITPGYIIMHGNACRHYWVELTDGTRMDIATRLVHSFDLPLEKSVPDGVKVLEVDGVQQNDQLFELYTTNPKTFWTEFKRAIKGFKI